MDVQKTFDLSCETQEERDAAQEAYRLSVESSRANRNSRHYGYREPEEKMSDLDREFQELVKSF